MISLNYIISSWQLVRYDLNHIFQDSELRMVYREWGEDSPHTECIKNRWLHCEDHWFCRIH